MSFKYIAGGIEFERFEDARRFVLHVTIPRYTQEFPEESGWLLWDYDMAKRNAKSRANRTRWTDEANAWDEESSGEPFFSGKAWLLDNIVAIQRFPITKTTR